jgi:hypothetical protein
MQFLNFQPVLKEIFVTAAPVDNLEFLNFQPVLKECHTGYNEQLIIIKQTQN